MVGGRHVHDHGLNLGFGPTQPPPEWLSGVASLTVTNEDHGTTFEVQNNRHVAMPLGCGNLVDNDLECSRWAWQSVARSRFPWHSGCLPDAYLMLEINIPVRSPLETRTSMCTLLWFGGETIMARIKLDIQPITACGKKRHYSRDEAHRYREQLAAHDRRFRPSAPPVAVYHCRQCDAFHVGHAC